MSDYTQLIYNVDSWYDSLNDVHNHTWDGEGLTIAYPKFNQYYYCYLSCISEFSDDFE